MKKIFAILALCLPLMAAAGTNTNGIWVWSSHMNQVNLDELKAKNIGNVILHEVAFEKHGVDSTMAFIKAAEERGILVHIWFQCFYSGGKWVSPINDSTKWIRQEYYDSVIDRARKYVGYGVKAFHLDYIRYGGTAKKHNVSKHCTPTWSITEFCRQFNAGVKGMNPDIIISAALMPEIESEQYYGQNPEQMGEYVDILMPMIYRHSPSYKKLGPQWPVEAAKWFVEHSGNAQVWAGTTTYNGGEDVLKELTAEEIVKDSEDFRGTGVKGVVLFRFGLGEIPSMPDIQ